MLRYIQYSIFAGACNSINVMQHMSLLVCALWIRSVVEHVAVALAMFIATEDDYMEIGNNTEIVINLKRINLLFNMQLKMELYTHFEFVRSRFFLFFFFCIAGIL